MEVNVNALQGGGMSPVIVGLIHIPELIKEDTKIIVNYVIIIKHKHRT